MCGIFFRASSVPSKALILFMFPMMMGAGRRAAAQWSIVDTQSATFYTSVDVSAQGHVMASGAPKRVRERIANGPGWQSLDLATQFDPVFDSDTIRGVHRFDPDVVVAAGTHLFGVQELVLRKTSASDDWDIVHLGPAYTGIKDMEVTSAGIILCVGDAGRILRSTDAGASWIVIPSGTTASLYALDMVNGMTGFAVGNGVVLRTADGGLSWQHVFVGTIRFREVSTSDGSMIYALGQETPGQFADLVLKRSTNGGVDWESVRIPFQFPRGLEAVGPDEVYLAGGLNLYYSGSAGNGWYTTSHPVLSAPITDIDFRSQQEGYAVSGSGVIYATTNGGGPMTPMADLASSDTYLCVGGTVSFTNHSPPGLSYVWRVDGVEVAATYDLDYTFTEPGDHVVTLTVSNGLVGTISEVQIMVNAPAPVPTFTVQQLSGPACEGAAAIYRINDGLSFPTDVQYHVRANGEWVGDWTTEGQHQLIGYASDIALEVVGRKISACGESFFTVLDTLMVTPAGRPIVWTMDTAVCAGRSYTMVIDSLEQDRYYQRFTVASDGSHIYNGQWVSGMNGPIEYGYGWLGPMGGSATYGVGSRKGSCTSTVAGPYLFVGHAIEASFTTEPLGAVLLNDTLRMINTSIGTEFDWDLGVGAAPATSTEQAPAVVLSEAGLDHPLVLEVRNGIGCVLTDTVRVNVVSPLVDLDALSCDEHALGDLTLIFSGGVNDDEDVLRRNSPIASVIDRSGNVIVTGNHRDQVSGNYYGRAIFLTKYDPQGYVVWQHRHPQEHDYRASGGVALDVNDANEILLAGVSHGYDFGTFNFLGRNLGGGGDGVAFVVKLNAEGEALWSITCDAGWGSHQGIGISDVEFLDNGDALFVLNASMEERTIVFANGHTYNTEDWAPLYGVCNFIVVRVDQQGRFVSMLPGGTRTSPDQSGQLWNPWYFPDGSGTGDNMPIMTRLHRSCDGSVHVLAYQTGRRVMGDMLVGEVDGEYWTLATTSEELDQWNDVSVVGEFLSGSQHRTQTIYDKPHIASEPDGRCLYLARTMPYKGGRVLRFKLPSDEEYIGSALTVLYKYDPLTDEVLWSRRIIGLELADLLLTTEGDPLLVGQATDQVSIEVDGEYRGATGFDERDIVMLRFDPSGSPRGLVHKGGLGHDRAVGAVINACNDVQVHGSLAEPSEGGNVDAHRAKFFHIDVQGTCDPGCNTLQLTSCGPSGGLTVCSGTSVLLQWEDIGDVGAIDIWQVPLNGEASSVLASDIDPDQGEAGVVPNNIGGQIGDIHLVLVDDDGRRLDSLLVHLHPALDIDVVSSSDTVCAGGAALLAATPGFAQYLWSNGEEMSEIEVTTSGTWSVQVMEVNGCTATAEVDVLVLPGELFNVDTLFSCGADQVTIEASEGYADYIWSTGGTGPADTMGMEEEGVVFVTATTPNGCSATDTVHVRFVDGLEASFVEQEIYCAGSLLALSVNTTDPVEYHWMNGSTASVLSIASFPRNYSVIVTDMQGCTDTASIFITPETCVGMFGANSTQRFVLAPNPATHHLRVACGREISSLAILDLQGRPVHVPSGPLGARVVEVDVSGLASGSYMVHVSDGSSSNWRVQFVKQ